MNARMPDLKRCFEAAGFSDVRTLLSSGNVVFDTRPSSPDALAKRCEKAMREGMDRSFATIVRPARYLQDLVESDPFAGFEIPSNAKRVVTFFREPVEPGIALPIERDGARILKVSASEAFTCYVPGNNAPVFMTLIERTFGTNITTRTLDTVRKCATA
jgi:uncharacterized protein (DUF1697 family)